MNKFKIGTKVKIISESVWKGKEGVVRSIIEENGYYRISGLEMFPIAFDESELKEID